MRGALTIVSNRLPISVTRTKTGFDVTPSIGGLATGLSGYTKKHGTVWLGWPGIPSDELTDAEKNTIAKLLRKHRCRPVWLTKKQVDDFYSGYSNSVLWPVFHELEPAQQQPSRWWRSYREVNALFAIAVEQLTDPENTIWVHDYQLLLLPGMIRSKWPSAKIGFFLHIPFPSDRVFTTLPEAPQLIRGILGADLVGLHTDGYVQNLLDTRSILKIGTMTEKNGVARAGHVARIADFPMGIDYDRFAGATVAKEVRRQLRKLRWSYRGQKIILTVDRLDPTKGLYERLAAYQHLLRQQPDLHGKVTCIMVAVPSRTDIPAYQELRERIETLVNDINDTFGTNRWLPVRYMFRSLPFETLSALYQLADVAFIAPIKDGMNLVAKEYIASKTKGGGALVLSTQAGAATELTDAILVDSSKKESLSRGLNRALTMPKKELKRRLHSMQQHLQQATVHTWSRNFMHSLSKQTRLNTKTASHRTRTMNPQYMRTILDNYHTSNRPLIILDYDGTLREFEQDPTIATPSSSLANLLSQLAKKSAVAIVSGRRQSELKQWFGALPITLISEHGTRIRPAGKSRWQTRVQDSLDWRPHVQKAMENAVKHLPGSRIENKEFSFVWHYRGLPVLPASITSRSLYRQLRKLSKSFPIDVRPGKKVIEVLPKDIDKGSAVVDLLKNHDFVLVAGDDTTDEHMFSVAPPDAITIKVGTGKTVAQYRVATPTQMRELLRNLVR